MFLFHLSRQVKNNDWHNIHAWKADIHLSNSKHQACLWSCQLTLVTLQEHTFTLLWVSLSLWSFPVNLSNQVIENFINVDLWFGWCFQESTEITNKQHSKTPVFFLPNIKSPFTYQLLKLLARFCPWSFPTTRSSSKSHLFPTRTIGTW